MLYLELTDGKTILRGLEYELINNLDRDTTLPGAKVIYDEGFLNYSSLSGRFLLVDQFFFVEECYF